MKALIAIVILLLAGCGSGDEDNHGYGFQYDVQGAAGLKLRFSGAPPNFDFMKDPAYYEKAFAEVEACSKLQAPAPFIILVKNQVREGSDGFYMSSPSLILLTIPAYPPVMKHEFVHYLLDVNTGDLDPNHKSSLFNDCTL